MLKYKQNRRCITITCDFCGKEFLKPLSEYKRNQELNRHNFCSRSCACKFSNLKQSEKRKAWSNSEENKKKLLECNPSIRRYKENPKYQFTYYLRNCKKRYKECSITLDDLYEQWQKQNGICPYSGIKLKIATYTKNHKDPIYAASIDRIDSTKGYIPGNIQFVSTCLNYLKNTMSDSDTRFVCKCIAEHFYSDRTISLSCSKAA